MGIQIKGSNDTISAADGSIVLEGATLTFTNENITGISTMASAEVSGNISIADKIIHTGDTNTAIRFPSADTVSVETGGSERLRITSAGDVGISTLAPASKLHLYDAASDGLIVQSPSGLHYVWAIQSAGNLMNGSTAGDLGIRAQSGISVSANNGSGTQLRVDSSGRLLVGSTSSRSAGDVGAQLQVEGTTYHTSSLALIANAGASAGNNSHLTLAKSRGSSDGSDTILVDGDSIGIVQWAASDGTDLNCVAAEIRAKVNGTPGANDMPGSLQFGTTADGAVAPTTRLTIASTGFIGAGTVSPRRHLHVHNSASATVGFQMTNGATGESNDSQGFQFKVASDLHAEISQMEDSYISIYTDATERLRIDEDGKLLIALTAGAGSATAARLQVRGDVHTNSKIQVLGTHNDDNPASLVIAKSRGSGNVILGDNDDIGQLDFAGNDGNGFHIIGRIAVSSSGEGNGDDDLPTVMRFFTTGNGGVTNSERMRINSDGQLLLGGTSAYNVFENSSTAPRLQVRGTNLSGSCQAWIRATADAGAPKLFLANTRSTAQGGQTVVQSGDELGGIYFTGSDGTQFVDGASIRSYVGTTPGADDMPGYLAFWTTADGAASSTERARFTHDGKYNFGHASNNAGSNGRFYVTSIAGQSTMDLHHSVNDNENVLNMIHGGVGVNGNPTRVVVEFRNFANNAIATIQSNSTTVTYNTGSDYRMKENQLDISDGITRVKQLKPYRFNWKSEYGGGDKVDGFFAHEAATVVPEAVQGTKDAVDSNGDIIRQQIDPSKLVPLLTAALKEAITKIETLETKVAALESS